MAEGERTNVIRCESLSKTFVMHVRGGTRLEAFRDVSFTAEKGTFLGISGPSGSGKSSLLKCLYRTYVPSSGEIWYTDGGRRPATLRLSMNTTIMKLRRQEIGYVSQFFPVIPRISALDTIANGMVARGFAREESTARARELLEGCSIPRPLWDMFPRLFPVGEAADQISSTPSLPSPLLLSTSRPLPSIQTPPGRQSP